MRGRFQRSGEVYGEAVALAESALPADSFVLAHLQFAQFNSSLLLPPVGGTHTDDAEEFARQAMLGLRRR